MKLHHKMTLRFLILGSFAGLLLALLVPTKSESSASKDVAVTEQGLNDVLENEKLTITTSKDIKKEEEEQTMTARMSSAEKVPSVLGFFENVLFNTQTYEIEVQEGDTLSSLLEGAGIDYLQRAKVLEALEQVKDVFKPSDLRSGKHKLVLKLTPLPEEETSSVSSDITENTAEKNMAEQDESKEEQIMPAHLESLKIVLSPVERLVVLCDQNNNFSALMEKEDAVVETIQKEGIIPEGGNFSEVAANLDIPNSIVIKVGDIYAFDVDWYRGVQPGDKFSVMYEQRYASSGELLKDGYELLYAQLELRGEKKNLYRFEHDDGKIAFYDENGKGAAKGLKRSPLGLRTRISSGFGMRKHPILGFSKMHTGTDFPAGTGTPIPAAGEGVVVFKGWKGGYGNYIKIRHHGTGYETAYAHCKSFARSVGVGTRVHQGQIVAYVGSTGRSTGPHLHYEVIKNGKYVNPMTITLPPAKNLEGAELEKFASLKEQSNALYASLQNKKKSIASLFAGLTP